MKNLNNHVEEVERKICYKFRNLDLLFQAFTRSSYSTQYGGENNEVLEFIGDRVLDYYVVKVIAERFGFTKSQSDYYKEDDDDEFCIVAHKNESDFTELKKEIVSNKNLARRIDALGFADYMYMGDSDIANHIERQEKVKADLFEAILGAIAIDSDWNPDSLQNSVEMMLNIEDNLVDVDTEEERPDEFKLENSITTLKEMAEHGICSVPEYESLEEQVLQNGRYWWVCSCTIRSLGMTKTALASSKKEAKRYAAYLVLCDYYGIPDEFEEEDDE